MSSLFGAFGIELHLLIAQLINFGVLFIVLMYLLYKPVLKVLDERRAVVAKGVEDAREAEEALKGAGEKVQEMVRTAETDAEDIVTSAREQAGTERDRITNEARMRAENIESDAKARAEEESARVMRESEKEIARLAILAAEKAMRTS